MDSGEYIWRTVRDGKVRGAHAVREGKLFSWTNPPPGGHPAEDYNCRCWAETTKLDMEPRAECTKLSVDLANSELDEESLLRRYLEADENANNLSRQADAAWEKVKESVWGIGLDISVSSPSDFAKKLPVIRAMVGAAEITLAYQEYGKLNSQLVIAVAVQQDLIAVLRGQEQKSQAIREEINERGCNLE